MTIPDLMTANDLPALAKVAHKLKGSSGTIGAIALAHACAALERLATHHDPAYGPAAQAVLEAIAQLDEHLVGNPRSGNKWLNCRLYGSLVAVFIAETYMKPGFTNEPWAAGAIEERASTRYRAARLVCVGTVPETLARTPQGLASMELAATTRHQHITDSNNGGSMTWHHLPLLATLVATLTGHLVAENVDTASPAGATAGHDHQPTPRSDFDRIVFVKRNTYNSNHYYTEYINSTWKPGGTLCTFNLKDGAVTELLPSSPWCGGSLQSLLRRQAYRLRLEIRCPRRVSTLRSERGWQRPAPTHHAPGG